jgi:hypothetical protein
MTRPESLPVARSWYRVEAVGEALTLITEPRVRGLWPTSGSCEAATATSSSIAGSV